MKKLKYTIYLLFPLTMWIFYFVLLPNNSSLNAAPDESKINQTILNDSTAQTDSLQSVNDSVQTNLQDSLRATTGDSYASVSGVADIAAFTLDSLLLPVENNAFRVGEKLKYSLKYEFIKAGSAQFEVKDGIAANGQACYRIVSTAKTTRTFDWVYKVRDTIESLVDKKSLFSWRYLKQLREGGYKYDLDVQYDHLGQKAFVKAIRYHSDMSIRKKEAYSVDIPRHVRDVFGTLYYLRTQPMEVGKPIFVSNHDNRKVYNLRIIIEAKEVIEVKAGKFHCLRVQPILEGDAIFKQKGRLWVWFTDDDRKIPVKLKSKAFIGAFNADLDKIEGANGSVDSRIVK